MTTLTKAQRTLLNQAAASQTGAVEAEGASPTTVAGLIKQRCLIAIPVAGGPSRLLITEVGRAAVVQSPATAAAEPLTSTADIGALKGKIGAMIGLLKRPEGATLDEMMRATGWQAHSVRGAISGSIKKAMGLGVLSEKIDGVRVYRILTEAAA